MENQVTDKKKPRLNVCVGSHFLQHYIHGGLSRHEQLAGERKQHFRMMIISKRYVSSLRSLLDNQLTLDMVLYNKKVMNSYKLRFIGTFVLVYEQFMVNFFPFVKPRRFIVLFGYDERVISTKVIDALRGATKIKIHSNSCTTSISYALETLGSNLELLHCQSTQLIRPFIELPDKLKFKTYSGSSGTLNHVLAFEVENIEMTEILIFDKNEYCPIQPTVKVIKLRCKFEEFETLYAYLSDLKENVPNLQKLVWNAEFSPSVEKVNLSKVTNFLIETVDTIFEKLRRLTQQVKCVEFKYFKAVKILDEEGADPDKWTRELEGMGYFVENCVEFQLYNDPHGCIYQKNIHFNHSNDSIKAVISIGIMYSSSYV